MEQTDTHQANQRTTIRVESQALDALRTPLTVILAQAQLLERRMLQGHALTPDDILAALSAVQRSGWDLEGQLRVLQRGHVRQPVGDD